MQGWDRPSKPTKCFPAAAAPWDRTWIHPWLHLYNKKLPKVQEVARTGAVHLLAWKNWVLLGNAGNFCHFSEVELGREMWVPERAAGSLWEVTIATEEGDSPQQHGKKGRKTTPNPPNPE